MLRGNPSPKSHRSHLRRAPLTQPHGIFARRHHIRCPRCVIGMVVLGLSLTTLHGCQSTKKINEEINLQRANSQQWLHHIGSVLIDGERDSEIKSQVLIEPQGADFSTHQENLPAWLHQDHAIRYASAEAVTISQILSKLSQLTEIPHVLLAGIDGQPLENNEGDQVRVSMISPGLHQRIIVDMDDPLPAVLDRLSERFGLAWRFEEGRVVFRQFVMGRYQLALLPSQSTFSSSVGNTQSTGSIDLNGEIVAAITLIAGEEARISFGEASGLLTVLARPHAQRRVADYVRDLNNFMRQQVTFDVNVLTVSHRQTESFALDFDIFAGVIDDKSVHWTTEKTRMGGGHINVGVFPRHLDLKLMVSALAKLGDVTVETRTGATTSNNQIVPIEVVNQTAYAKSVKTLVNANGESNTTIEPGTLTSGFEMLLLPRILASGDVLIRYSIKLSDLNELENFTSDKQTIQLPQLSTTSFEQQAILGNHETLVLMGFERDRKVVQKPNQSLWAGLSGLHHHNEMERISTVLTIRPRFNSVR